MRENIEYLILKYNSKIEELEDGVYCGDDIECSQSEIYVLKNIVEDLKQVLELEIINNITNFLI